MNKWESFLCDIYKDDEILHEKIEVEVFFSTKERHDFVKNKKFMVAAEEAMEEKEQSSLESSPEDCEGNEYKVEVTHVSSGEKRTVKIAVEVEHTISYSFSAEEEV